MEIKTGDLLRSKETGEIFEITGQWGNNGEHRANHYHADGRPHCGANGQHNTASNFEAWYKSGGLERLEQMPTRRALIRTSNYGNYYGKRFVIENAKVIQD